MENNKDISKLKEELLEVLNKNVKIDDNIKSKTDSFIESISDKNKFNNLEEVKSWFEQKVKECPFSVEEIGLKDVKGWHADEKTGNTIHESKGFFKIIGVRTSNASFRELGKPGWDQPIIDQGTESSIAGIIKKNFEGIPHYLIQAKAEPGNYGKLQLSPTFQATFSNLQKAHKGRKPTFAEYFEEGTKHKITYKQWLPEDGGRFFKKRVLNMIVEVPDNEELGLKDDFIWLTLYQIKELLKEDNIVNSHVRSIIAHL
jgi:dTDP-4-dehydro-6-deoxy-alpha-D-glucopyranose 2,3-dehydratase